MEASVEGDSDRVSHNLRRHFCMDELPSGNCASDLPFKVGEELVSLMSSTSNSSYFVLFLFLRKKFRIGGKK